MTSATTILAPSIDGLPEVMIEYFFSTGVVSLSIDGYEAAVVMEELLDALAGLQKLAAAAEKVGL